MKPARLIALAAALSLAGCISPQNDRITVGQKLLMPTFQTAAAPIPPQTPPAPPPASMPPSAAPTPPPPPPSIVQPSVLGIDRSNWARTEIWVPVDGTVSYPPYTHQWHLADKAARQRREYPTAVSALDLYNGSQGDQELEALLNTLQSVGDLVLLPISAVILDPFWHQRISPLIAYDRTPRINAPPPEGVPPPRHEGPFTVPVPVSVTP